MSVQRDSPFKADPKADAAPVEELQAIGLSEDGERLVLSGADGRRYAVPVDERLRTIVRGRAGRLGQQEVRLESALSPREMQARLRAGASAAEVARSAGIPIERVERYEGPVLAERARVVTEARAARLPSRSDEPRRPLGEIVDDRLATSGVALHEAVWDAWRRPDGSWMVHVTFTTGDRERRATWSWDPSVRRVRAHDEDAEILVAPSTPQRQALDLTDTPAAAVTTPGQVELALVPEPDEEPVPAPVAVTVAATTAADSGPADLPSATDQPLTRADAGRAASTGGEPSRGRGAEPAATAVPAAAASDRPAGRKARPAVPSWDDIVFGTRRG